MDLICGAQNKAIVYPKQKVVLLMLFQTLSFSASCRLLYIKRCSCSWLKLFPIKHTAFSLLYCRLHKRKSYRFYYMWVSKWKIRAEYKDHLHHFLRKRAFIIFRNVNRGNHPVPLSPYQTRWCFWKDVQQKHALGLWNGWILKQNRLVFVFSYLNNGFRSQCLFLSHFG